MYFCSNNLLLVVVFFTFDPVHIASSTYQEIMDGICDGLPFGYTTTNSINVNHHEHDFLRSVFGNCKYALGSVYVSQGVQGLSPSAYQLDFLANLTRIGKQLVIHITEPLNPIPLQMLVAIGRTNLPGRRSLDVWSSTTLPSLNLHSLRSVENGNVVFNVSGSTNCVQFSADLDRLLLDTASQTSRTEQGPSCAGSCDSACPNCWGPTQLECQQVDEGCHSTCTNGCFGTRSDQCCSALCKDGCRGRNSNDCFKFAECPNYSDIHGSCILECQLVDDSSTTSAAATTSPGYLLYDMFCVRECPGGLPFTAKKYKISTGITEHNNVTWIPIDGRELGPWLTVKYEQNILFHYAMIYRKHSSNPKEIIKDVTFFTNGADEWDRTSDIPNIDIDQWELCKYGYGDIGDVYMLTCQFGEKIRLVNAIGITSDKVEMLKRVEKVDLYGFGGENVAKQGTTIDLLSNDGIVEAQFTRVDTKVTNNRWWKIVTDKLIQLSHAIIYTNRGFHCNVNQDCYRLFSGARLMISVYDDAGAPSSMYWQRCSASTSNPTSNRHLVKSCNLLDPAQPYPYMRTFAIISTQNLYLAEVEIYKYERENLGFFTHNSTCVSECPDGHQPNGKRQCVKSAYNYPDKHCDFKNVLYNESNHMTIPAGCSHVTGHVIFNFASEAPSSLSDKLRSIREIAGSLIIVPSSPAAGELNEWNNFWNLQFILGSGDWRTTELCTRLSTEFCSRSYSLVIKAISLNRIELTEIWQIRGSVYIDALFLCLPRDENVPHALKAMSEDNVVRTEGACISGLTCNSECAIDCVGESESHCLPCTPESPDDCRMCKNFQHGKRCLLSCAGLDQYIGTNQCGECHEECIGGCRGPSNKDCQRCKNVQFENECIEVCPLNTMTDVFGKVCFKDLTSGFNHTVEEKNLYRLHISYDGADELSWFVEFLPDCRLSCQRDIASFQLDIEYTDQTLRTNMTISPNLRRLRLRPLIAEDIGMNIYGLKLQINTTSYGLMKDYYPIHFNITGLGTTTTTTPTTTTTTPTTITTTPTTTTTTPTTTTTTPTTTTTTPTTTTTTPTTTTTTSTTSTTTPTTTTTTPTTTTTTVPVTTATTTVYNDLSTSESELSAISTDASRCCECISTQPFADNLTTSSTAVTFSKHASEATTFTELFTTDNFYENNSLINVSTPFNLTGNTSRNFLILEIEDCTELHANESHKKGVEQLVAEHLPERSKGGRALSTLVILAMVLGLALMISGCTLIGRRERKMKLLIVKDAPQASGKALANHGMNQLAQGDNLQTENKITNSTAKKLGSDNPLKAKKPKKPKYNMKEETALPEVEEVKPIKKPKIVSTLNIPSIDPNSTSKLTNLSAQINDKNLGAASNDYQLPEYSTDSNFKQAMKKEKGKAKRKNKIGKKAETSTVTLHGIRSQVSIADDGIAREEHRPTSNYLKSGESLMSVRKKRKVKSKSSKLNSSKLNVKSSKSGRSKVNLKNE